jgi:hypothetical protein
MKDVLSRICPLSLGLALTLACAACSRPAREGLPDVARERTPPKTAIPVAPAALSSGAPAATPGPAPAPEPPACPAPYSCDLGAWDRAPRPAITEIFVQKGAHRLHLVAGTTIVRSYGVALGYGGMGPKKYEGDGVTPVGVYTITDRLQSKWHTFLGVSYPSLDDQRQFAQRRGRGEVPYGRGIGFGIALHGHRDDQQDGEHKRSDWTLGCIALDNPEIDEVASAVKRGTRIVIVD